MDSEWSYELRKTSDGRYAIAVHHYRHLTRMASTSEEKVFDTLLAAVDWLKETLHA